MSGAGTSARPSEASGAQRAAAFLLSLEKEAAANVLKHLDESVIVEVVEAMAELDPSMTSSDSVRNLYRELIVALRRPRGVRLRSEQELRAMLESTLGAAQAESVFGKINQRLLHERPFIAIEKEPAKNIAVALAEESDAVVALVLAHMDPSLSAEVLGSLDPARSLEVVRRMASLIPPSFETLLSISRELEQRLKAVAAGPVRADPSLRLRSIAEVLNFSEPALEQNVLQGLDQGDSKMAAEIRELMFTWEDLARVDKRAMQKILASVDTRTLAISLKACSAPVEENVLGNLSSRVREMVADERELAGALPMAEVQSARAEIMKAVRALAESGEFRPARAGEDLVT